MKKFALILGLSITLAANVFAADNVIDQLNSQVISVLAPIQNEATVARLTFDALETNPERATKIALNALYRKIGSQNTVEVKIDNLSYNYGDGSAPTTILKGSLGIDFTKLLPQDQINAMIPEAARMMEEIAKNYSAEEYGDAVSINSVVTSTTKDNNGNYTGFTALLAAKVDLTKLPEHKKSEDILATNVVLSLTINLKSGIMIDAFMISNPEYLRFKDDQQGLKEVLDKLLARDEEAMAEIADFAMKLDDIAGTLVEMSNALKYLFPTNGLTN